MAKSTLRPAGKFLAIEPGVDLYYEDSETPGSPLVFVPGWTFSSEVFDQQVAHFRKKHRVIVLDPRSQGRSSVTLHGNDYATQASDLAKLLQALKLRDIVLVGWSFGSLSTWGAVKQLGVKPFRGIVTLDLSPVCISADPDDWTEGPILDVSNICNAIIRSPQGQRDFIRAYAKDQMVQRKLDDAEMEWLVNLSANTPHYVAALSFASGNFSNYLSEAKFVDASLPAMSVLAQHWSAKAVPFMQKHCPHTRLEILGGHMMFWEHPTKFNRLLDSFLDSLPK